MNTLIFGRVPSIFTFFTGLVKKASGFRKILKIVAEVTVIPTMLVAWAQLSDIAQASTITAEAYISNYENEFDPKWFGIDKFVNETVNEFEQQHGSLETAENISKWFRNFDAFFIEKIAVEDPNIKGDIDRMAFHFRSVLFCVADQGRCDEHRVVEYYKPHICSFVQKTYGYLQHMYATDKWKTERGDLLQFKEDYKCREIDGQKTDDGKIANKNVSNKTRIWVT